LSRPSDYTRINRKLESKYGKQVLSSLNKVKDDLINLIETYGAKEAIQNFNNKLVMNGVAPIISKLYVETGLIHAKRNYVNLRSQETKAVPVGLGFSRIWTDNILEILRTFLVDKILFSASETTKNMLLRQVSKGIEEGLSVTEIVKSLEDYPGLQYQADRIVRTEVNRAANLGVNEAGKSFKYEQNKTWVSIRDIRTRGANPEDHANHLSMHGQTVDFNSPFIDPRNNDRLMNPGDPEAKAESTINCRCTMTLKAKRDERGRLIPKRGISVIMPGQIRDFRQTITI
jgi:hypothetical protein